MRYGVLLLAFALIAGCLGSGGPAADPAGSTTDGPSGTLVVTRKGDTVASDRAVLKGRVVDDLAFPIASAHVALLGTSHSTTTAADGTFAFANVTIGEMTLRVDAEGYVSHEAKVVTRAGETTEVHVILVPPFERGAGYRPHFHDYWGDKTEYVLMDADIDPHRDFNERQATNLYTRGFLLPFKALGFVLNASYEFFLPDRSPEEYNIVLPGTKEIRVTLNWVSPTAATNERLGFAFRHANMSSTDAVIASPAKRAGEAISMPVDPEWADYGHQRWTFWHFFIHTGKPLGERPDVVVGPIHVKIVLVKGDVAPEPPHRDFWGDSESLVLRSGTEIVSNTGTVRDWPTAMVMKLPKDTLVPPGSTKMRMEMWWNHTTHPAINKDVKLRWHTADMRPEAHPSTWKTATPIRSEERSKVYEIDLAANEPDAFYQRASNWAWRLELPEDPYMTFYVGESWQVHFVVKVWRAGSFDAALT